MVENDSSITVAALLERINEWVTTLKKKSMIPVFDEIGHNPFIDDPPLFSEWSSNRDSDFVVVSMRPTAFPLMMQQSMAGADANRSVSSNREYSFLITD